MWNLTLYVYREKGYRCRKAKRSSAELGKGPASKTSTSLGPGARARAPLEARKARLAQKHGHSRKHGLCGLVAL